MRVSSALYRADEYHAKVLVGRFDGDTCVSHKPLDEVKVGRTEVTRPWSFTHSSDGAVNAMFKQFKCLLLILLEQ